jgi:hypothetical protein
MDLGLKDDLAVGDCRNAYGLRSGVDAHPGWLHVGLREKA